MIVRKGTAVSPGMSIGPLYRYVPFEPDIIERSISNDQIPEQLSVYEQAVARASEELRKKMELFSHKEQDKQKILKAHLDILEDCALDDEIRCGIELDLLAAEGAILRGFGKFHSVLAGAQDPLLRERAADLIDVRNRLLRCCSGVDEADLSHLSKPVILVAKELLPSDTASLDPNKILGLVTEQGGTTSHTAILAKSYGIPAVLGVAQLLEQVENGEIALLDALSGTVTIGPSSEEQARFAARREVFLAEQKQAQVYLSREACTKDGIRVYIKLNIGSVNPAELEYSPYSDGIGLFRTEFLYMKQEQLPTEEEQLEVYRKLLTAMPDKPVVLRTLDVGGDKKIPCLPLPEEPNPFLGKRALRLCFERTDIFRTQLRAALRASVFGHLWIMFPMVGSMEDFRRAKDFLYACREELQQEKIIVDEHIPIGAMVEIPSIALLADKLAEEADFVSIGTNDLTQYLTATDRMNQHVAEYYQSYHPALFRTIGMIAKAFRSQNKPVSICGELGGDPLATPALLGLGISSLSMSPSSLARVKQAVCNLDLKTAQSLAESVTQASTAQSVLEVLSQWQKTSSH